MKKILSIISLSIGVLALPLSLPAAGVDGQVYVVSSDDSGMVLEVTIPEPDIKEVIEDIGVFHKVTLTGYAKTSDVGRPELPVKGLVIGLPDEKLPPVKVLRTDTAVLNGYYNIYPAPAPVLVDQDDGMPPRLEYEFAMDRTVYNSSGLYPPKIVETGFTGLMRDQWVMQLKVFPLQFNPAAGELLYHSRITIRVDFPVQTSDKAIGAASADAASRTTATGRGGAYERLLKGLIINYDDVRR